MIKTKGLFAVLCIIFSANLIASPANFSKAKRVAKHLFQAHRKTIYCSCSYDQYGIVDLKSCGMLSIKRSRRAKRIEWEHIVPAEAFGHHFKCWREKVCRKKNGKSYRGRKCCEKIDKQFRHAEAELYNLWPAVGAVNQYRSNYRFTDISSSEFKKANYFYGCPIIKVKTPGQKPKIAIQGENKGVVARAYLFMHDKYNLRMSKQQQRMFQAWDEQFKPTDWELTWAKKVAEIEGYSNPYIENHQMSLQKSTVPAKSTMMLPPKYLSVPGFKQCLSLKNMGTWESWCLPKKKPTQCANVSWKKLQRMEIPVC